MRGRFRLNSHRDPIANRRIVQQGRLILQGCLLALSVWGALVAPAFAGDPPSAKQADSNSDSGKQLTDEEQFQRLKKQALDSQKAGKGAEAIAAGEKLVQLVGQLDGAESEAVAWWQSWLGFRHDEREEWSAARQAHERAVAIRAKLYGEKDSRVTDGRWDVRTLDLRSRMTAENRAELSRSVDAMNQVRTLYDAGQYLKAIPIAKRALEIRERILGREHPWTAASLAWLAYVDDSAEKYAEAEPLYRQALDLRQKLLGVEHPLTAETLNDLGLLYRSMGNAAKGEPLARQAVAIRRKLLGDEDLYTATSLDNLGMIDIDLKQYAKAEPEILLAIKIRKQLQGEKHADTATSLNNLGWLYQSMGDYAKAEPMYRQALDIRRQVLGKEHDKTISATNDLASVYTALGQYAKAEPLYQEVVEVRRKVYGPQDPLTATSLSDLGVIYGDLKQFAKAESLLQQALDIRKATAGPKHENTAVALSNLGWLYQSMDDYARAEPCYRQAFEIRQQALGETDDKTVDAIENLATVYESMQRYAQAEPLYQKIIDIRRKTHGPEAPVTATSLHNLAVLYWRMGEYAKSEPLYLQAISIYKKTVGEQHASTALSLKSLAILYESKRDYAKAIPLCRQALEAYRKIHGELHESAIQTTDRLAQILQENGDNPGAESLAMQVLEACRKRRGPNDPLTVERVLGLAALYKSGKEYAKAEPLYRQALESRKQTLGDRDRLTAQVLCDLGTLFSAMGDDAKAVSHYRQALDIQVAVLGEEHQDTANTLDWLGRSYQAVGDYAEAEAALRRALAIERKLFGENDAHTALILCDLSELYAAMDDVAQAKPLQVEALAIRTKILGENNSDTAVSMNDLATLYDREKLYDKAEPLYRKALEIQMKLVGEDGLATAICMDNLAVLYRLTGEYAKAEPLALRSLALCEKSFGREHLNTAVSLQNLSQLYRCMGNDEKSVSLARQALEITQSQFDRNLGGLAERQQLTFEKIQAEYLHTYLSASIASHGHDAEAYGYVLKSKGSVTARQSSIRLERRRPALKPLFDELDKVSIRLANLALANSDPKQAQSRRNEIEQLSEQKETLERKLAAKSVHFAQMRDSSKLGPKDLLDRLRAVLPPKTALVDVLEYWNSQPSREKKGVLDFDRQLVAFVVRSDGPVKRVELGWADDIGAAVEKWRTDAVAPDRPKSDGLEFATKLRNQVWDKLEPHLSGADTILFSPDGPLCRFPLGALPGAKPDTYLIEERTIVVLPLPRLLPQLVESADADRSKSEPESLLLVGDVEYGGSPGHGDLVASRTAPLSQSLHSFARLDHSAAEVAAIQLSFSRHFKKAPVDLLLGEEATESAFRQQAATHRWLHLATHGFYDPPQLRALGAAAAVAENPNDRKPADKRPAANPVPQQTELAQNKLEEYHPGLLSGLALAGANSQAVKPGEDDGILTALEVSSLDLSGVELAVLSACETGLGGKTSGEGLLGLQRAFQIAGARSVMAGLWRVPDRETMLLMQRFYQNVWTKKMPKGQALRDAQIWMLKETKPRGLDVEGEEPKNTSKKLPPKYWAGFVLSGDWR